jgi:putative hydrolase of the HAD superfamily
LEIILIKAIVFDFDGLIIDTETVWYECFNETLSAYGIPFPLDVFGRCIGTGDNELKLYIEQAAGTAYNYETIRAEAAQLHQVKIASVAAREGVRDFLEEAKRLGLRIGLASSSNRTWIERFLHELNLHDFFEIIMTSDDVKNIKPHPELYLRAIEALGVEPDEALAFEDSVNGAKAAKAAGLRCIIVPNPVTEKLAFESYDIRIRSMGDHTLADLISRLNEADHSSL